MTPTSSYQTAGQISDVVQGQLIGDAQMVIKGISAIDSKTPHTLTFFGHPRYTKYLYQDTPRAILVPDDWAVEENATITFIRVADVYEALSKASEVFQSNDVSLKAGQSVTCVVDPSSSIAEDVGIGHFSFISERVKIGRSTRIGNQVSIHSDCVIGKNCVIQDGVKILPNVTIGDRCVIQENAVIGGEGFGYAPTSEGYRHIVHQARVIIEDDVVVGCNTCIDRGAIKDTIIRQGTKLDNLIQVAHGVEIGSNVAIAAQTGISGSSQIGEGSLVGGQVGIAGHVKIAPGTKIQGQSGITSSIKEPGRKWYGYPAISYFSYLRSFALFKRLPELLERIRRLENKKEQ